MLGGRAIQTRFAISGPKSGRSFSSLREADGFVLGVYKSGNLTAEAQRLDGILGGKLSQRWEDSKRKKKEECLVVPTEGKAPAPLVALVGLGEQKDSSSGGAREAARRAAKVGISVLSEVACAKRIGIDTFGEAQATAEGTYLSQHKYRTEKSYVAPELFPLTSDAQEVEAWEVGTKLAQAQNFARVLAETPSNLMTPSIFANCAVEKLSGFDKVTIHVRDKSWIEEKKMGCLIGVSKGSAEPPRFLEIHYRGGGDDEAPLALVGKGITFDSGGISIKPATDMGSMRGDMSGAASVVGTILGLATLKIPRNVIGFMPLCENMPSGTAVKPGDVLVSMSGKTIEVDNTDAEGRLVLADALHYSLSFNPHTVIDIATLTGAMSRALGDQITGVLTNSEGVWTTMEAAGVSTGETVWRMPLHQGYKRHLKSNLADLKNSTPGPGAITAALFLREFVKKDTNWMHMDIAGTNQRKTAAGKGDYFSGMTGTPVRTLIEFARTHTTK